MDSGSLWIQVIIIIVLTLINAFFAGSELAFVSVNQNKMKQLAEEGDKRAARVLKLLEDSDGFLATIQVAITLAGFLSSASAATSFSEVLAAWLPNIPGVGTISIIVVTLILSYITLVFGELYPKQLALQMPEEFAMAASGVISGVQTVFKPFVRLLSASTGFLKRITPIDFVEEEEKFTRDEMRAIMAQTRQEGTIDLAEFSMLEGVLSLDNKLAREIMVPRTDTQMLDIEDPYEENIDAIMRSPYSRIPFYKGDKDNVVGVIHVKNVLRSIHDRYGQENLYEPLDLEAIMSEPLFVPSYVYIDDLLIEFRREQTHMAILLDEYGGVEGIVTMEDVLEEIVGEIEDESDVNPSTDIRKIDDENYYVNGTTPIDKFANYFNVDVSSDEVDTIAGLVIYHLGYVPDDDERIQLRAGSCVLTTNHIESGRIRGLHVQIDPNYTIDTPYDLTEDVESAYQEEIERIEDALEDNGDSDD